MGSVSFPDGIGFGAGIDAADVRRRYGPDFQCCGFSPDDSESSFTLAAICGESLLELAAVFGLGSVSFPDVFAFLFEASLLGVSAL